MTLVLWSSARYTFPLPEGHRFPVAKYAMLREAVIAEGIVPADRVLDPAARERRRARARAHARLRAPIHARARSTRPSCGGSASPGRKRSSSDRTAPSAARSPPRGTRSTHGVAMNLAGGTHHAFPDHGEGFCVFNDVAVAIRLLQREGRCAAPP